MRNLIVRRTGIEGPGGPFDQLEAESPESFAVAVLESGEAETQWWRSMEREDGSHTLAVLLLPETVVFVDGQEVA